MSGVPIYRYVYGFLFLGRPPGPEMENALNRECYSLSAGLALGLIMLEVGLLHFFNNIIIYSAVYCLKRRMLFLFRVLSLELIELLIKSV
jgi:hypothetical protein